MEPQLIENTPLDKWMHDNYKKGFIPYIVFAIISFFFLKVGVILTILYVGIRTELMISALRYGDTINSRRLEHIEEKLEIEVDYNAIHQTKG
jgi:hypothetical protein